jgi:predicted ATPase/transcriptional regulator with XRE-family HTH domain
MITVSTPSSFGAWLKQARKALDMTQVELAMSVGCSLKTIAKIESGERRPSKQLAELFASSLGIVPNDLPAFLLLARGLDGRTGPLALKSGINRAQPSIVGESGFGGSPNNLPAPMTEFIGRERLVASVCATLRRPYSRLVTLTGVGGVGKTRLSIEIGRELLEDFQDGIYFVDLSSVSDTDLFFSSIVRVLKLEGPKDKPPLELLKEHLDGKTILLVLDNFEQLMEAAPRVSELLIACGGLKGLITSREALRVRGEREISVPPLDLPSVDGVEPLEEVIHYEALRLFGERAQERQFGFAFTADNVAAIADICRKLDGLPLAIELATARIKDLSPEEMLGQIDNRLQLLTGPLVDLPSRQRTMRSTIAWSYNLLGSHDRQLFRRLAVFSGGFTPQSVCAVLGTDKDQTHDTLAQLERLADKSLLRYVHARQDDEPRFSMLETIHEFAREELAKSGEAETYRGQHANYFLALAEQAEPELRSAQQKYWFERLEDEHDNFRAALRWSLDRQDAELSLLLCGWLTMFWYYRGYTTEGRRWLKKALTLASQVSTELQAKLFNAAGILAWAQGDFNEAMRSYERSLAVWREVGDKPRIANTLYNIAGILLVNIEFDQARPILEELAPMFRAAGQKNMLSSTLNRLSIVLEHQGDLQMAETLCEECLEIEAEIGDARHIAMIKSRFGELILKQHQPDRAYRLIREALEIFLNLDDKEGIAKTLERLGVVEQTCGHSAGLAFLFGASSALRESIALPWTPLDQATCGSCMEAARSMLGEAVWQQWWADGRAATIEEAVKFALQGD